jgi:hypothetical protein
MIDQRPRSALADWLTNPKQPLTARVWVNRLWHYHFGRGLVATPGDFGTKGTPPTHPELLDWLAAEFMGNGWSTKHIHRLIVTSNTYRQSSQHHPGNAARDPDNLSWWRWSPRRMEAEAIRDSLLAVSGELEHKLGGPSNPSGSEKSLRRSLYLFQERDTPPAMQTLFDGPVAVTESCARRHVSTVPLQSLYLLNDEFGLKRAKALAGRVQTQAGTERERQVEVAFLLALGREPDEDEREAARQFFQAYDPKIGGAGQPPLALVHFCHAVLNLNEFCYVE